MKKLPVIVKTVCKKKEMINGSVYHMIKVRIKTYGFLNIPSYDWAYLRYSSTKGFPIYLTFYGSDIDNYMNEELQILLDHLPMAWNKWLEDYKKYTIIKKSKVKL